MKNSKNFLIVIMLFIVQNKALSEPNLTKVCQNEKGLANCAQAAGAGVTVIGATAYINSDAQNEKRQKKSAALKESYTTEVFRDHQNETSSQVKSGAEVMSSDRLKLNHESMLKDIQNKASIEPQDRIHIQYYESDSNNRYEQFRDELSRINDKYEDKNGQIPDNVKVAYDQEVKKAQSIMTAKKGPQAILKEKIIAVESKAELREALKELMNQRVYFVKVSHIKNIDWNKIVRAARPSRGGIATVIGVASLAGYSLVSENKRLELMQNQNRINSNIKLKTSSSQ